MKTEIFLVLCCITCALGQCWKKSYIRGIGTPIDSCNNGLEKSGLLCYDKCEREGFVGVGPVCWETCKDGFDDNGLFCTKHTHIYGKGCCCTTFTPECCGNCPADYTDDGCTCRRDIQSYVKESFGRGLGSVMGCDKSKVYHDGLCYQSCDEDYYGLATLCWQKCWGQFPHDCGGFCGLSATHCALVAVQMVASGSGWVGSLANFGLHLASPASTIGILAGDVFTNVLLAGGYTAFNLFNSCEVKPPKIVLNPMLEAILSNRTQSNL